MFVTNDPYRGGSHLPDVTVVTPVHDETGRILFFTASRAHHAEMGGIAPGSMPPFSKNLAEEGVLIRNFKLVDAGTARWDELRSLLLAPPYPTRNVEANLADIAAQVAANRRGARRSRAAGRTLLARSGRVVHAAHSIRRRAQGAPALAKLADGTLSVHRSTRRRHADRRDDHDPGRFGHGRLYGHRAGAAPAI